MLAEIEQRREALDALCRKHGALRLDAFGSAVRGSFDPAKSDLDFIVEFESLAPTNYANAYFALKEELEALFGRRVDLLTDGELKNPFFRRRVEGERQRIYAR
ncbi:MAG: nucleotidyltransferase domain-containing protein [Variovorax sp.]